jgi:alpha-D-ribose 1-methylphosphonate 5-triphosphate synthase subunit PhnH
MSTTTLHPIWTENAQQFLFRHVLQAMSYPGRIVDCSDAIADADCALAVLASLLDHACRLSDPTKLISQADQRLLETTASDAEAADWLVMPADQPPKTDWSLRCGTIHQPEASCTVVLRGVQFGTGTYLQLSGPGIAERTDVFIDKLDPAWLELRALYCAKPPMGIDLIVCGDQSVLCLPRTTTIDKEG